MLHLGDDEASHEATTSVWAPYFGSIAPEHATICIVMMVSDSTLKAQ